MRGQRLTPISVTSFLFFVVYFVLMLVLPTNSENYEIWPSESTDSLHSSRTHTSVSNVPVRKESSSASNPAIDNVPNPQSVNDKEENVFHSKGSFYYASSSNARQEDTSVHVFVKNTLNYKNQESLVGNGKKKTINKVSNKSCKINCDRESHPNSGSSKIESQDIPKKGTDVLESAGSSISSIQSSDSFHSDDQIRGNLNETNMKELASESSEEIMNDGFRSNNSDKVPPVNDYGGFKFQEDDFEGPSLLFARSLSRYPDTERPNKEQAQRSYSQREGIMGRRASPNSNPGNLVPSDDIQKRPGPVSRLPRLPEIGPPEETPPNDDGTNIRSPPEDTPPDARDANGNVTEDELKHYIAQMRTSRAASVLYTGDKGLKEECKTNRGSTGTCQPLTDCSEVMKSIRSHTPVICRWAGELPVVCCPTPTLSRKSESPTCGSRPVRGLSRVVRQAPRSIPELALRLNKPVARPTIAGGEESMVGAWPWMAGIYTRNFGVENFLCGAAIINERFLVTAAHCFRIRGGAVVPATRYAVRVGSIRIREGTLHLIDSITVHPEYRPREYYNDIAVIRLKNPINFEANIRPICLPTSPEFRRRKLMGTNVTVTGWGDQDFGGKRASILREVTVRVIDLPTCDKAYTDVRGTTVPRGITKEFICAGVPEGGKDACQRDSGGPLMMLENGVWTLIGVVSFGFQCAQEGYPGVYTRITHYLNWLQEVTSV